jgi:uncharacterized protein (TIRG00374 family)
MANLANPVAGQLAHTSGGAAPTSFASPMLDPTAEMPALATAPRSRRRRPWRALLALFAYGVVAWLVYRGIDREHFSLGFSRLRASHVALILVFALGHIGTRALRFDRLMRRTGADATYRLRDGIRLFLLGLSASAVTPGRAGDLIKSRLVREYGIGFNRGLGLVLVERVLDLLVICSCIVVAGAVLSGRASSEIWQLVADVLLVCLLTGTFVLIKPRLRDPLLRWLARLISRAVPSMHHDVVLRHLHEMLTVWDEVFSAPQRFLGYFAVSFLAWGIEFAKLWVVVQCLGHHIDIVTAFFVYPVSIVAGLVSLLPLSDAVVGVTGAVLMHTLGGLDQGVATTAIVVDRVAAVIPPLLLWGCFSLLARRRAAADAAQAAHHES